MESIDRVLCSGGRFRSANVLACLHVVENVLEGGLIVSVTTVAVSHRIVTVATAVSLDRFRSLDAVALLAAPGPCDSWLQIEDHSNDLRNVQAWRLAHRGNVGVRHVRNDQLAYWVRVRVQDFYF